MPAIRGIHYDHPTSGEVGLWVVRLDGSVVGRTNVQIAAFAGTGNPTTRMARLRAAVIAYLQPTLETRTPLSNWTPEEQAELIANPGPYCRVEGSDYVSRDSVVDVEVLSLSPLRYQITVSEGASRAEFKYA